MSTYEQVSKAMEARERQRGLDVPSPPNPYGSDPRFRCLAGNHWPLGGVGAELPPEDAIALGVRLGSAVPAYDAATGERVGIVCGPGACLRDASSARTHNGLSALVVTPPKPSTEQYVRDVKTAPLGVRGETVTYEDRTVTSTCGCCGVRLPVQQRRVQGGSWSPELEGVLRVSGWLVTEAAKYCGRACLERGSRPTPPGGVRDPVAVTQLPQNYLGRAQPAPSIAAESAAREIPAGKAPRRAGR